jgi:hypothetical protein
MLVSKAANAICLYCMRYANELYYSIISRLIIRLLFVIWLCWIIVFRSNTDRDRTEVVSQVLSLSIDGLPRGSTLDPPLSLTFAHGVVCIRNHTGRFGPEHHVLIRWLARAACHQCIFRPLTQSAIVIFIS